MITRWGIVLAVMLGGVVCAQEDANRAKLLGTWHSQQDNGTASSGWSLHKNGDTLHAVEQRGDEKVAEFECNTTGVECAVKIRGKATKVSMWYSGSALVEMEVRGSDVVQRRFAVSEDGNTLHVEITPIAPAGNSETVEFKRADVSAARQ